MSLLQERYANDAKFHALVASIECAITESAYTPEDVENALKLACQRIHISGRLARDPEFSPARK